MPKQAQKLLCGAFVSCQQVNLELSPGCSPPPGSAPESRQSWVTIFLIFELFLTITSH